MSAAIDSKNPLINSKQIECIWELYLENDTMDDNTMELDILMEDSKDDSEDINHNSIRDSSAFEIARVKISVILFFTE